ncbi:hypothetical protein ACFOLJ_23405 [Rugamonas sp. CCM 8940]|uniref:hypothetical protein n=1 Tax=Rugamonas sp. CCM 8940 TaxID=2765359 RepID=UPI0018F5A274|nr:hypothetical protein [Rugamonas sp. CCM 8940]MBJ7313812.1 hypothetical protein [Rugamonas sp. CCM 8940]
MNTILASEKAFSLAENLEQAGFTESAEAIRIAIYGGATGLEIGFRLRHQLTLLRTEERIPKDSLLKLEEIQKLLK